MLWHDETNAPDVDARSVDINYRIHCPQLPENHAQPLWQALGKQLPWVAEDSYSGIHEIHGGASGNGWFRPEARSGGDGILHLSRRTRLVIRSSQTRIDDCMALCGTTIDVAGYPLVFGDAQAKPLSSASTQFARRVVPPENLDELAFSKWLAEVLNERGISVRKLLCGLESPVSTERGIIIARSVLIADLKPDEAIALQSQVVGTHGHLGCGLFIEHKGVAAVTNAPSSDGDP